MNLNFIKNKKYGYNEPEEDEKLKKETEYIIKILTKRNQFDYTCIKRGLLDIIIEEGLEQHIKFDGEYGKCFYCNGQNIICNKYEPLIFLLNMKKKQDENKDN